MQEGRSPLRFLNPSFSMTVNIPVDEAVQRLRDGLRYEQRLSRMFVDQRIEFKPDGEIVHFRLIMSSFYPTPLVIKGILAPKNETTTLVEGSLLFYSVNCIVLPAILLVFVLTVIQLAMDMIAGAWFFGAWGLVFSMGMWVRTTMAADRLKDRLRDTLYSSR